MSTAVAPVVQQLAVKLQEIASHLSASHDISQTVSLAPSKADVYTKANDELFAMVPAELLEDPSRTAKVLELAYAQFQAAFIGNFASQGASGFVCLVINMTEFAFSQADKLEEKLREIPFLFLYDVLIHVPDNLVVRTVWDRYLNSPEMLARLKGMSLVGLRRPGTTLVLLVNQLIKTLKLVQSPENYDFICQLQTFIAEILPFNETTFQNRLLDLNQANVKERYSGENEPQGKVKPSKGPVLTLHTDFWYLQLVFSDPYSLMSKRLHPSASIEQNFTTLKAAIDSTLSALMALDKSDKSLKDPTDPYRVVAKAAPAADAPKFELEDVRVTFPNTPEALTKYLGFHSNRLVVYHQLYNLLSFYHLVALPQSVLAKTVRYAQNPKAIDASPIEALNLSLSVPARASTWIQKARTSIPTHFRSLKLTALLTQIVTIHKTDSLSWFPYVIDGFPDFWSQGELSVAAQKKAVAESVEALASHQLYKKRFWGEMMTPQLNKMWNGIPDTDLLATDTDAKSLNEDQRRVREWRAERLADIFVPLEEEAASEEPDELLVLEAELAKATAEYEKDHAALAPRKRLADTEEVKPEKAKRPQLEY